jgi:CheY-like chemotaxis protein
MPQLLKRRAFHAALHTKRELFAFQGVPGTRAKPDRCSRHGRPNFALRIRAAMQPISPLKGCRVLVVEDEYFLADDIARALSAMGAEIVGPIGEIGEAGRVVNQAARIDGAVLDINVRNESVFPVARLLRARRVPFVFASGYGGDSLDADFVDAPLWEKPLDVQGMLRALARMMLPSAVG